MPGKQLSYLGLNETGRAATPWQMHVEVARMAYDKGLYAAAVRNYRSAIAAALDLCVGDAEISPALLGLAKCYCALKNFSEAEALCKRVLQIDKRSLSPNCCAVAVDLNELASLYLKVGRLTEAEDVLQQSLAILSTDASNSLDLAEAEKSLGYLYCQNGQLADAERHINKALTICDTKVGRQTKLFAEVLIVFALLLTKKGSYDEAETLIEQAIASLEVLTGSDHPELADFLDVAADLFRLEKLPAKVIELASRADAIRKHVHSIDR